MEDEEKIPESLREVPASEILAKIEKGEPVEYDNVIIKGDLDIRKLDLPKSDNKPIITSQIKITNSWIKGKLNFQNVIIEKQAFFDYTYFGAHSCFLEVQFKKGAIFRKAKFREGAVFNEAKFDFQAVFDEAQFQWSAVFIRTQFNSEALFNQAWFIWDATFNEAQFNAEAHFWGTQFKRHALFDNSSFNKSAYFWKGAYFGGFAQFFETQFNGDVLTFKNAVFKCPIAQEGACRRVKNVLERNGDREEAGYHFYREMEAKRIQKGIRGGSRLGLGECLKTDTWSFRKFLFFDVIEFIFVQKIFGYGVHPWRLITSWGIIVAAFAALYLFGSGL